MSIINQGNAAPNVSGSVSITTATAPTYPSTANAICTSTTNDSSQSVKVKNLLKEILGKGKELLGPAMENPPHANGANLTLQPASSDNHADCNSIKSITIHVS